jgi:hypothetical protein
LLYFTKSGAGVGSLIVIGATLFSRITLQARNADKSSLSGTLPKLRPLFLLN